MYLDGLQRWRSLNGRLGLRAAVWLQAKVRGCGLELRPRLTDGLSVTYSTAVAAALYK